MNKYIIMAAIAMVLPLLSMAQDQCENNDACCQNHQHGHNHQHGKHRSTLSGHIIDGSSGEKISYATISVAGTDKATLSDIDGNYELNHLSAGEIEIEVSMMGYKTVRTKAQIKHKENVSLDITLNSEALSLDQVVVTSSRNAEKKTESVAIVNVISPRLFTTTASLTPADALNFGSGMRVEWNCNNCGVPQLRINGLEGQYSQVLLDSRPMFSSLAAVYGLEQMPSGMIERVEVIRGGGSALFGSNAVGGVVNIITKEPVRNSFSLGNMTTLMGKGATDVNTNLNGSFVSDDSRTGVYIFGNIRNRKAYDRNDDGFSDIPELNSSMVGFRAYQKIAERGRLTAEYHHIKEKRRGGDNLGSPPHEALIAEQLTHNIDGGSLKYDYHSRDYKDRISIYTSLQNIGRDSYFGTDRNPNAYGTTKDFNTSVGVQWSHSFDRLLFMPSTLTAGVEYNYDNLSDEMLGYNRKIDQKISTIGGYFQNEWKNKKVSALLGLRIDKHNLIDKAIFSPRINFRYAPSDLLAFRASYSAGYRAPQAYEEDLHVEAVGGHVSLISLADGLRPEFSHSLSSSIDLYKNFGNVQTNLLVEGFYTNLQDVFVLEAIGTDFDGNLLFERRNGSGAYVGGVNSELRVAFGDRLNMQVGFTIQRSRYKEEQVWSDDENVASTLRMFRSPDTYGYITASYPFAKRFNASVTGTYTGSMIAPHFKGYIEEDRIETTPSFFDMGVRLSYYIGVSRHLNMEVAVGAKNLFDSYQKDLDRGVGKDAGYIYGPALPRSVYFSLRFYL